MHRYQDLRVYQQAIDLVEATYACTRTLPKSERFGLVPQMNRAAVSVAANIAEGAGRGAPKDFARFVRVAKGSVLEIEAQVAVCERLGFSEPEYLDRLRVLTEQLKHGLHGLDRALTRRA